MTQYCSVCGSAVKKHWECSGSGVYIAKSLGCGGCHNTGQVCSARKEHDWAKGRPQRQPKNTKSTGRAGSPSGSSGRNSAANGAGLGCMGMGVVVILGGVLAVNLIGNALTGGTSTDTHFGPGGGRPIDPAVNVTSQQQRMLEQMYEGEFAAQRFVPPGSGRLGGPNDPSQSVPGATSDNGDGAAWAMTPFVLAQKKSGKWVMKPTTPSARNGLASTTPSNTSTRAIPALKLGNETEEWWISLEGESGAICVPFLPSAMRSLGLPKGDSASAGAVSGPCPATDIEAAIPLRKAFTAKMSSD